MNFVYYSLLSLVTPLEVNGGVLDIHDQTLLPSEFYNFISCGIELG